jgi:hypothetical protein
VETVPLRAGGATMRDQSGDTWPLPSRHPGDTDPWSRNPASGKPTGNSPPDTSAEGPEGQASKASARPPWWIRFRRSIVLFAIAVVSFIATIILYPSTAELPTPPPATLGVVSNRPLGLIQYAVTQVSSDTAEMEVLVELQTGASVPPAGTPVANLVAFPPIGTSFTSCPAPACEFQAQDDASSWKVSLVFKPVSGPNGVVGTAFADFYVHAHGFGDTYNGVNASVSIPKVIYTGPGTPLFQAQYKIPDAVDYDWPLIPAQFANTTFATWSESVTGGMLNPEVASGIDYTNQSRNTLYTFLAGVTLGVAGGALVSTIQEAIPDGDKKQKAPAH